MYSIWRVLLAFLCLLAAPVYGQVDVNGDNVPDPLRFEKGYNETVPSNGLVEVLDGDSGTILHSLAGAIANEGFGYRAAYGPDLTNDGIPELLVSIPLANCSTGPCASRVDLIDPTNGTVVRTHSASPNEVTGIALDSIGDIDGDTYADYVIESASSNPRLKAGIYSTVYSGVDGVGLLEYPCSASTLRESAELGYPLFLPEDVDFDGDVDEDDVSIVAAEVGNSGPDLTSDIDDSGAVDQFDLEIVVSAQGMTAYIGKALDGANTGFCGHFGSTDPCVDLLLTDSCGGSQQVCEIGIIAQPAGVCGDLTDPVFISNELFLNAVAAPFCGFNTSGCSVDWEVFIYQPEGLRVETYSGFYWTLDDVRGDVDIYVEYTWFDDDDIACCIAFDELYLIYGEDNDNDGVPDVCGDAGGSFEDDDGDTFHNFCEAILGTDPDSPNSHPLYALDSDGDGLSDASEVCELGTSRYKFDTDNDGVDDYAELKLGTNPRDWDTDGDTFSDLYDPIHSLGDLDQDGISDTLERAKGWDTSNPDQDGDGVIDGVEIRRGFDPASPAGFLRTNSSRKDTDGDGLFDHLELINGTDPAHIDSDEDALFDLFEVEYGHLLGISPNARDTDGDTVSDALEDFDGDGLTNLEEELNSTNPANADSDGDTLSDGYELANYLDPRKPFQDSDNDGQPDTGMSDRVTVTVGDPSGSESERYLLYVGNGSPIRSPGWGEVTEPPVIVTRRRGMKHAIRLQHQDTDPEFYATNGYSDYDYVAEVTAEEPFYVDDPEDLLGNHGNEICDDPDNPLCDYFSHKRATLYFPFDCGEEVSIDGPDAICINDLGNGQVPAGSLYRLERPSYIAEPISVTWSVTGTHVTLLETADPEVVWVGPTDNTALPEQFTLSATVEFPGNENCGQGNTLQEVVEEVFEKELHLIRVDVRPDTETHDADDVSNDVLSVLPFDSEIFTYTVEPSSYDGDITFTSLDPSVAMFNLGNGVYDEEITVSASPGAGQNAIRVFGNKDSGSTVIGCGVPGDDDTGICGTNLSVLVGGSIELEMRGLPTFETPGSDVANWNAPALPEIPEIGAAPAVGDIIPSRDSLLDTSIRSILQANPTGAQPLHQDYISRANSLNQYDRAHFTVIVRDSRGKAKKGRPVVFYSHYDRLVFASNGGVGGPPQGPELLTTDIFTEEDGTVDITVFGDITEYDLVYDVNGQLLPEQAFQFSFDQLVIGAGEGIRDYVYDTEFDISDPLINETFTGDVLTLSGNRVSFLDNLTLDDGDTTLEHQDMFMVVKVPIVNEAYWTFALQALTEEADFPYDPNDIYSFGRMPMTLDLYNADTGLFEPVVIPLIERPWETYSTKEAAYDAFIAAFGHHQIAPGLTFEVVIETSQAMAPHARDEIKPYLAATGVTVQFVWNLVPFAPDVVDIVHEGVVKVYITNEEVDVVKLIIAEVFLAVDVIPGAGSVISAVGKTAVLRIIKHTPGLDRALRSVVGTGIGSARAFVKAVGERFPMTSLEQEDPTLAALYLQRVITGIANEHRIIRNGPLMDTVSDELKDDIQQSFLRFSIGTTTNGERLLEGALKTNSLKGIASYARFDAIGIAKIQQFARQVRQTAGMTAARCTKSLDNVLEGVGTGYQRLSDEAAALGNTPPQWFQNKITRYDQRVDDALSAATKSVDDLSGPLGHREWIENNYIGDGHVFESIQEFQAVRTLDPDDLTQAQRDALKAIRDAIPKPEIGSRIQKVIAVDNQNFSATDIISSDINTINSFYVKATDMPDNGLRPTTAQIDDRLAVVGFPGSGLSSSDSPHAILDTRVTQEIYDNTEIPRRSSVGGTGSYDPDYQTQTNVYKHVGSGYTYDRDGYLCPENATSSPTSMPYGVVDNQPQTTISFRHSDGTDYPQTIGGQTSSVWYLDLAVPGDPTQGFKWYPWP